MAKLDDVLKTFRQPTEKMASATDTAVKQSEKVAAAGESLKDALRGTLAEVTSGGTKTASAVAGPQQDLEKIAADTASAEHSALVKEAMIFGAAAFDGMVARATQYQSAVDKLPNEKVSYVTGGAEKFAQDNAELLKQAAEVGFAATSQQLEQLHKLAAEKGEKDATEWVFKTAHDSYLRGYGDMANVLKQLSA